MRTQMTRIHIFGVTPPRFNLIADKRKITLGHAHDYSVFQFDNKKYIVTNDRVQRQNLDDRCKQFGSGYKPAYINYKEEYEM